MTVIAPKVFSQEEYLAQLRKPPDFNITPQRPGLGQRLWHLLDVARRRLQIGFEPHERQHSVEGVDFRFLVASPEAEDWYEKGKGAQEHRPDLAFWKSSLVRPGDLVFDCGGFQGFTTVFLARCVGDQGRVVTFELNPQNAAIIEKNISLNQLCNAEVERVAVGNESGNVQFLKRPNAAIIPSKNSWLSTLQSMVFGREEAAQIALDDYCSRHELWPTVIKIDVEGYEVEVLAGARALLRSKPRLAIELHPDLLSRRGQNADDIFEYLDRDSFSFWIQWNEEDAPVPYDGSPITERVQFFALPR